MKNAELFPGEPVVLVSNGRAMQLVSKTFYTARLICQFDILGDLIMIRTLLTTTALAAMLTTGAFAADTMKSSDTKNSGVGVSVFATTPDQTPMDSLNGYFSASHGQILATTLIGQTLYNGTGDNAENIGDVNDVVIGPDGTAEAVVVGVGGFLGMGEKDVAVDFDRIGWVERDGEKWLTIAATQKELEAAPAFDRSVIVGESTMDTMSEQGKKMVDSGKKLLNDMTSTDEHKDQIVVDVSTISAEELIGTAVYGADEKDLGEVNDVIVSGEGKVEAYIIDVGGFLGIGEKPVAMNATKLNIMKDDAGDLHIYTNFTQEQLETYPAYSEEEYRKNPTAFLVN